MKTAALGLPLVALVALAAIAGCTAHDYVTEHKWTIEAPTEVMKGTEFPFKVKLVDAGDTEANGVGYHYQIHWPGGSAQPLRHLGRTGEEQKRRAGIVAGKATVVVTCENKEGALVKVAEATVEVK
jgi:hypothetical protein